MRRPVVRMRPPTVGPRGGAGNSGAYVAPPRNPPRGPSGVSGDQPVFEFVIKTWALKTWKQKVYGGGYAARDYLEEKKEAVGEFETTVRAHDYAEAVQKVMAARPPLPTTPDQHYNSWDSVQGVQYEHKHEMVSMQEVP